MMGNQVMPPYLYQWKHSAILWGATTASLDACHQEHGVRVGWMPAKF